MPDESHKLLWTADELKAHERAVTQRLNPNSHLVRTGLSRLAGLRRAHVSLGRLPPGKDSFAYHAHMIEEEWVYILSGRGLADSMAASTRSGQAISWASRRPVSRICCATRLRTILSI